MLYGFCTNGRRRLHGLEPLVPTKCLMYLADQGDGDEEEVIFPLQKLRDRAGASCAASTGMPDLLTAFERR